MGAAQFGIRRRRDSRLRTDIPAKLITLSSAPSVKLRDLSQTGAQIECPEPLSIGSEALLNWLHFEAFGTVQWNHPPFAGLEFDEPLPEEVVLSTREKIDRGEVLNTAKAAEKAAHNWYLGLRD